MSSSGAGRAVRSGAVTTHDFPYRRVAKDLAAKIRSGEIRDQLPPRAKLAETYGVADLTVGRAIQVLKDEGLVESVPGLGVFVKEPRKK